MWRRRSFTFETLNPTEMNHEGHEEHEEIVFVFFVAILNYFVEGGGSRRYARFVSGRVWIGLPVLFDPDTDPDPDPDSHTRIPTHAFPLAFVMICGAAGTPLPYPLRAFPWAFVLICGACGDAAALPASRMSCGHAFCLFRWRIRCQLGKQESRNNCVCLFSCPPNSSHSSHGPPARLRASGVHHSFPRTKPLLRS